MSNKPFNVGWVGGGQGACIETCVKSNRKNGA